MLRIADTEEHVRFSTHYPIKSARREQSHHGAATEQKPLNINTTLRQDFESLSRLKEDKRQWPTGSQNNQQA